ncbi:putative integral membrane protein [Lasiodiplodia theobromae]|nr:putative integral membrane protein [Lasiodiplodia theobromae]
MTFQIMLAIELLNSTSTCLTKVSILFFYRRLGRGTYTTTFLLVVQTNIVLIGAYLLSFSIVLLLTCHPFAAHWLQFSIVWAARNTYRCMDEAATTVAANAVSIAQDFVACCLPAVLLWKLQMSRKKKVLLGLLLGLGILPCVAGVLRLYYTVRVYQSYDATWTAHTVLVWTVIENHLGILCACAPALHSYGKEVWRSYSSLSRESLDGPDVVVFVVVLSAQWKEEEEEERERAY